MRQLYTTTTTDAGGLDAPGKLMHAVVRKRVQENLRRILYAGPTIPVSCRQGHKHLTTHSLDAAVDTSRLELNAFVRSIL